MADTQQYTTSDPQFWRVGKSGGMVPYNHPDATDQQWTGTGGTTSPAATTNTGSTGGSTQPYSGSIDPGLQTVKPASGSGAPLPYSPSIPLGPTAGGSYPTDTSTTTTSADPNGGGTMTRVADPFGTGTANGGSNQLSDLARARLLELLGTDVNNVSTTDADIAPASRAYTASVQREADLQRQQAMEEANVEGSTSSGATRARLGGIGMGAAQAIGANDASLIGAKQQQRIDQLKTAIGVATSMGMADQANDLQRQLANLQAGVTQRGQDVTREGQRIQLALGNLDASSKTYLAQLSAQLQREGYSTQERLAALDAEVRKLGIQTQGDLGQLDIALRTTLGTGQLNLGLLQALLQNNQANNTLGLSAAQIQAMLNGQTVGAGLGGA